MAQLVFLRRRARRSDACARAIALAGSRTLSERWLATAASVRAHRRPAARDREIDADLARPRPMQRLLMGEVGSGKTVVALYAMLRAVEHGHQAALMAPTETLAEQHFATIQRLLGSESVRARRCSPAPRRRAAAGTSSASSPRGSSRWSWERTR